VRFAFIVPAMGAPGGFYDVLVSIMRAAAERLGVELEVVDCQTRVDRMLEAGRALVGQRARPDCVFLVNHQGVGRELLPMICEAGLNAFVLVEGMAPSDVLALGRPRGALPRWLGELCPDDVAAGGQLARLLVDRAGREGTPRPDGKIHVAVIAGDQTTCGQLRFQGWLAFRKERPEVVQVSVQYANWLEDQARDAAAQLLRSHPEVSVVWAANDDMALGTIEAIREIRREPGRDVLVGGMDLLPRALRRVGDGSLAVTLGGHVLDGARALLLVHDHLQGRDFEPWSRRSLLEPVTAEEAPAYLRFFEGEGWRRVDFGLYSRARTGRDVVPELSLGALVHGERPPRTSRA
jgi:ABC-type sugar transport system substrate-binding protein